MASIAIFVVVFFVFYSSKKIKNIRYSLFEILLWISFSCTIFDIASVSLNGQEEIVPIRIFFNTMYYVFHFMTPVVFACYSLTLTERPKSYLKVKKRLLLLFPAIISLFFIVTNRITKLIFTFSDDGMYHRGPLQFVIYVCSVFYLVLAGIHVTSKKKVINKDLRYTIYHCVIISLIPVCIQFFYPHYLLECFGSAISLLLILLTLQNDDEITDSLTKMLIKSEFINMCSINKSNKSKFSVLFIKTPELDILSSTYGTIYMNSIVKLFSDYIYTFTPFGNAYYLSDGCYAITFYDENMNMTDDIASKIHKKLENPWDINDIEVFLSAYTCIVSIPNDIKDAEELIDYASYMQKLTIYTKRCILPKDISLPDRKRTMAVENAIKYAIENKSFEVYYQPIYSIKKKKIVSAEALVRLKDETLGFIPPDEFIPLSEQNGTIIAVGECVFDKVCQFISENDLDALGIEYVEVNLSLIQCMQTDIDMVLLSIMERYNVPHDKICLEITETATVSSLPIIKSNMQKLCKKSMCFALDDYGTGRSNLQQLVQLPFKFVKFDKNMVWSCFENKNVKTAITSSIVMMKKLDLKVIAEGVETLTQVKELENMNCDFLQGYYFSRPVPEKDFLEAIFKFNNQLIKS